MNEKKTLSTHNMLDKPTIVFLHPDCSQMRGSEKYIYEMIKRIKKTYNVILFIESLSPYWKQQYQAINVQTVLLFKPQLLYWFFLPLSVLINYLRVRSFISNSSIIFATNFPLNFLAVLLSKKTIFFCFEPLSIFYDTDRLKHMSLKSRFFTVAARVLFSPLDKYAAWRSTILTTLNSHTARFVRHIYKRNPDAYLPNGVDTHFFSFRKKNDLKKTVIILHSTDYTVLKGTELFIHSLPLVYKTHPNIHVLISESVINTKEKNKYINLINSYGLNTVVTFVGNIPEKNLPSFYQKGSVFCYLGSPYCGGGSTASLSVLESAACGTPVVRSFGGVNEIVDKKTGFFVRQYTKIGVSQALHAFLNLSPQDVHNFSLAGRSHVLSHFNWDRTTKNLSRLIEKLYYA